MQEVKPKKLPVLRHEDLLSLTFELYNLTSSGPDSKEFRRDDPNQDAFVVIHFPPQHIFEETNVAGHAPDLPKTELSGTSWLAFRMKKDVLDIPRTLAALLDWGRYLDPLPPAPPGPGPYTAIEIPTRLMLAPEGQFAWEHTSPSQEGENVALWHTRLVDQIGEGFLRLRAVDQKSGSPFNSTLSDSTRRNLVNAMKRPNSRPIEARQLMLSSLGGWLNVNLYEDLVDPAGPERFAWLHKAAMGRDLFVYEMVEGYLFPFGHRCQVVRVSERLIDGADVASGKRFAHLHQELYLRPVQREVTYDPATAKNQPLGRQMPFKSVKILTDQTPRLAPPTCIKDTGCAPADFIAGAFWPMETDHKVFEFEIAATDLAGREIHFRAPLIWMNKRVETDAGQLQAVIDAYRQTKDLRQIATGGQTVTFAAADRPDVLAFAANDAPEDLSNTTFETSRITIAAEIPSPQDAGIERAFFPVVEGAMVNVAALERLSNQPAEEYITPAQKYLAHGFDAAKNGQQVFANIFDEATEQVKSIDLPGYGDRYAQLGAPPISGISALSKLGVVIPSDPSEFLKKELDKEFSHQIKLFGGFLLEELIDMTAGSDEHLPKMQIRQLMEQAAGGQLAPVFERLWEGSIEDLQRLAADPQSALDAVPRVREYFDRFKQLAAQKFVPLDGIALTPLAGGQVITFEWSPRIAPRDVKSPFLSHDGGESTLKMHISLAAPAGNGLGPGYTVDGKLTNFAVNILPSFELVTVHFRELGFVVRDGHKPKLTPVIDDIEFKECLEFVLELVDMLKKLWGDFGKGAFVKAGLDAVEVGFETHVPDTGIGMINISNINLGTGLMIPFNGDPLELKANFCERHRPFILQIGTFMGGGYFMLAAGLRGLTMLEAGFEFGACLALNLGVASGGVAVTAGFYYHMEKEGAALLTGFIKLSGWLSVLGMIEVSAVFCLSLTYDLHSKHLWGQASLTVTVRAFMFKKNVTMTVERSISRSGGLQGFMARDSNTSLANTLSQGDWTSYAEAFAAEG